MRKLKFSSVLSAATLAALAIANCQLRAEEPHNLKLNKTMVVSGISLQASSYGLRWDIQGERATVTFSRKGHTIATVAGKCAVFDRSVPADTIYFSKSRDGSVTIYALGFASTNKGIVFPVINYRSRHRSLTPPLVPALEASLTHSSLAGPKSNQ